MRFYEGRLVWLLAGFVIFAFASEARATDGYYDPTWSSGGYFAFDGDYFHPNYYSSVTNLLPDPGGGVLMGGIVSTGCWIGRLFPNGLFAPTFGPSNGTGRFVDPSAGGFHMVANLGNDRFLVLEDNRLSRINVAAQTFEEVSVDITSLVLNDVQGKFTFGVGIAVQPDGKVLLAGDGTYSGADPLSRFTVVRLNSNLTLDTTFNAITDGSGVHFSGGAIFNSGYLQRMLLQPDGRIVLAGDPSSNTGSVLEGILVLRLNPDGSLDNSFNNNGYAFQYLGSSFNGALSMTIDRGGRIILSVIETSEMAALALTSDGQVAFYSTAAAPAVSGCTSAQSYDVAVDSAGRILLAGACFKPSPTAEDPQYFLATRFKGSGVLDASFGVGGYSYGVFQSKGVLNRALSVLFDGSGRPVLGGDTSKDGLNNEAGVARLDYDLIFTNDLEAAPRGCLTPHCP